ncbi:MAG TPA: flagellin [Smithellaceae bacterium]|nr:flagellin [Smithellaceae bacterium]
MSTGSVTLSTSVSQSLTSLKATQSLLDDTSYRLATGKKVNSAIDDPLNYFAADEHTQKASDLQVLKDAMSEGIETINAADAGITGISDLIDQAKSLAKSAQSTSDTDERLSYMTQYNAILGQIDDMAEDSGYSGINLLGGATEELEITFNEDGSSAITITGIDGSSTGLGLTAQTGTTDWADTDIEAAITALDDAKSTLRAGAKTLSSQLSIVTNRQDFTDSMITLLEEGAANLVNADTTEEGVKLTTLETQQSLAVQALSIASSASQAVLNLFS